MVLLKNEFDSFKKSDEYKNLSSAVGAKLASGSNQDDSVQFLFDHLTHQIRTAVMHSTHPPLLLWSLTLSTVIAPGTERRMLSNVMTVLASIFEFPWLFLKFKAPRGIDGSTSHASCVLLCMSPLHTPLASSFACPHFTRFCVPLAPSLAKLL
jgi:hypothetical protein